MRRRAVYQSKIPMDRMDPPIYRRLLVDPKATLAHLHEFRLGEVRTDENLNGTHQGRSRMKYVPDTDHLKIAVGRMDNRNF